MNEVNGNYAFRMSRTVAIAMLCSLICVVMVGPARAASEVTTEVTADFAVATGFPLLKSKFNLYNTAIPSTTDFERDVGLLSELNVESMRIEHNWGFGQTLSGSVGGTPHDPQFDWEQADHWQRMVNTRGLLFHWGY
ncbi:MAG: hypothetical protein JWN98_1479, partial [Abditibacteriota bacterium]|nr:hypothetical protein [Abditibacteriota bacterium]